MCDKEQYTTYKLAQDALKALATRHRQSFRVYKCDDCSAFHLTSIATKKLNKMPKDKYPKKYDKKEIEIPVKIITKKKSKSGKKQQQNKPTTYKPFQQLFHTKKNNNV